MQYATQGVRLPSRSLSQVPKVGVFGAGVTPCTAYVHRTLCKINHAEHYSSEHKNEGGIKWLKFQ
jgi:hypothetical protein